MFRGTSTEYLSEMLLPCAVPQYVVLGFSQRSKLSLMLILSITVEKRDVVKEYIENSRFSTYSYRYLGDSDNATQVH